MSEVGMEAHKRRRRRVKGRRSEFRFPFSILHFQFSIRFLLPCGAPMLLSSVTLQSDSWRFDRDWISVASP
jgi:hypothetical protein